MEHLNIGCIVGTHGLRGDVKVLPTTDFIEERFKCGEQLLLEHSKLDTLETLTVERYKVHRNLLLVKFTKFRDINEAEVFKGGILKVPIDKLVPVRHDEWEYHFHELIGCIVVTDEGRDVGKITDILSLPANDVFVVSHSSSSKQLLIPFIQDVVLSIDLKSKKITIKWLEGLE